jgi:hypothetical protein
VTVASPVLEHTYQVLLEGLEPDRKLRRRESRVDGQKGADLLQEPTLEAAFTEFPQHRMEAHEQRLIRRSLAQAAENEITPDREMIEDHRLLGGEVTKDSPTTHPCRDGDLIDRCFRVSLAREQVESGLGYVLTRLTDPGIPKRGLNHAVRSYPANLNCELLLSDAGSVEVGNRY